MKHRILLAGLAMIATSTMVNGQGPSNSSTARNNSIVGVWRIVESPDGRESQPSIWIFTAKHFSRMAVVGRRPRARFRDPSDPTSGEKVSAFDSFVANTGAYEIRGNSIVFNFVLAKSPELVGIVGVPQPFELNGSTLTVRDPLDGDIFRLTRLE